MTVFMAIASDPHTFKPSDVFQWNQWIPQKTNKKKSCSRVFTFLYTIAEIIQWNNTKF